MALSRSATEGLTDSELRATAVKQLVAFAAVAVATCLVVQGIGHLSEHVGQTYLYRDRLFDLPRVLPVWAARDEPQVLVFGASGVEQEVFTEVIDDELVKAGRSERVYNVGISSMVPDLLPRVVEFVTAAYRRAGHRPAAIVLEMSPDWFTWAPNRQMEMEYLAHWGTPREFVSRLWQSPEDGLILFGRRYALGRFSGDYITFRFMRWLDTDVPSYFGDLTEIQRVIAMWPLPPRMTVENHGSPSDPKHVAEDRRYAESIHLARQAVIDDELAEISGPFREAAIQNAIAAIHDAQAHADKVFLLFLPRNPCFLPAGFSERADQLIARFVKETGASVLDFRSEERNCEEFEDLLHVLPLAAGPRFSRALGKKLAEQL
jgi:hypothetical protein